MEREAMEFAVELLHTSKTFHTMVCNRLEIITHEDLDTLGRAVRRAVRGRSACAVTGALQQVEGRGPADGSATPSASCAGRQSHAPVATSQPQLDCGRSLRASRRPIPDWANDQHTLKGKAMGRGLDHFRSEGAKLIPEPTDADPYEDEAYRLWAQSSRASEPRHGHGD
jgi:hypothetical protein